MQRVSYEVDPFNRLVIDGVGTEGGLEKFRRVLDGRFKTDEGNNLSYRIKSPIAADEDMPHQLRLDGEWSLTDGHELRLTLDKEGRDTFGDEITLRGQILDVDKNSLLFSILTRSADGKESNYVLNLQGLWKADENNRLSFHVRKEGGKYDILTFNGVWEINKYHQIIYQYKNASLITKKSETQTLIFKGRWDIKEKFRISYLLDTISGSGFDFNAGLGILEEDYIKYEVGIGVGLGTDPTERTIVLLGEWKIKKDAGIFFEIEYEDHQIHAIVFGADIILTDRDTVSLRLKDRVASKDMGMTLELSQKIFDGDGELFLRALASRRELAIYAGAAWSF